MMFKNVMITLGAFGDNSFDPRKQIIVNIDDHTFIFIFNTAEDLHILFGKDPVDSAFYRSFNKALSQTTSNFEMLLVTKHIHRYLTHIGDDV